jgi:hypothetical protein
MSLALAAACGHKGMSDSDRAKLGSQLAAADAATEKLDEARRSGLVAASGAAEPSAPRQCPPDIVLVHGTQADNFVRLTKRGLPRPKTGNTLVLEEATGLRKLVYQLRSQWPRDAVKEASASFDGLAAAIRDLERPDFWSPYEIAFVIQQVDPPHAGLGGFSGGTVSGRVLVWSYDRGQLACWAPVSASLHDKEKTAVISGETEDDGLLYNLYSYADEAALEALGVKQSPGDLAVRGYE